MAVEARRLNLFPTQLLTSREMINGIDHCQGNGNLYNGQIGYGLAGPLSGTTTETLLPMYGCSAAINDSVPPVKHSIKSDSGLSYGLPAVSRKRSRDAAMNPPLITFPNNVQNNNCSNNRGGSFTFLGEDISFQIQQQQLEVDRFIAQHAEKVRMEIEERRKRYSRRIIAAVEEGIMKKLKAKEEEIEKIGKLNWALEEKVKSLCVENQIWRDLAQTNEATANALRSNLEHVLAQVHVQDEMRHRVGGGDEALMDDAQSCCGSNWNGGEEEKVAVNSNAAAREDNNNNVNNEKDGFVGGTGTGKSNSGGCSSGNRRMCRNCGKEESCVLLLPCRHLCLCTVCGSSLHTCPVCKSIKNASVHVNLSS